MKQNHSTPFYETYSNGSSVQINLNMARSSLYKERMQNAKEMHYDYILTTGQSLIYVNVEEKGEENNFSPDKHLFRG